MSTDFWTFLQNFERISTLKPSVETEKVAWLDGPLVSFRIRSREDDIKDTTWGRFTGMRWWEGGKGESSNFFFFPGTVHLTIIPQCFFPFTGLSMTWISNTTGHRRLGECCCTYVQSASYSYGCTKPLTVYELQSGQSYHTLIMDRLLLLNPVLTRLTCNSCQPSTKCIGWIERTHT